MLGGERTHTKNHSRRTIPQKTEGNNPHLASEKQVGWPNRWLSMLLIPHGVAGFSCPDPATTQLNKCLCMDWTTPSVPACTSAASSHLSDDTWSPPGTTPDTTSQQAGAYAELVVKVHAHLGQEAEGAILGCELETKKLHFLSVTREDTHTGSTAKELRCQTKCIS